MGPPWNGDFGEVDMIMVKDRWKNSVGKIRAKQNTKTTSDHALLITDIRTKLKGRIPKKKPKNRRYVAPDEQKLEEYNAKIKEQLEQKGERTTLDDFAAAVAEAVEQSWPAETSAPRRSYITAETWALIEQRQKARTE